MIDFEGSIADPESESQETDVQRAYYSNERLLSLFYITTFTPISSQPQLSPLQSLINPSESPSTSYTAIAGPVTLNGI